MVYKQISIIFHTWPEATEESQLKMLNLDNLRGLFIVSVTSKAIALSIFLFFILRKKICLKNFILRIFSAQFMRRIMMRYLFPNYKNTNMIHNANVEMTHVNPHWCSYYILVFWICSYWILLCFFLVSLKFVQSIYIDEVGVALVLFLFFGLTRDTRHYMMMCTE